MYHLRSTRFITMSFILEALTLSVREIKRVDEYATDKKYLTGAVVPMMTAPAAILTRKMSHCIDRFNGDGIENGGAKPCRSEDSPPKVHYYLNAIFITLQRLLKGVCSIFRD